MMTETAVRRMKSAAVLLVVFLFMLVMNHWMPLHRDDYDYSLIWGTTQHVASLNDVFQSMENHYLTHGGRMVTVFVLDLFLWLGKSWFDLANAAAFTVLVVLLCCHSLRNTKFYDKPGILALSALFLWLCLPHFGEVAVWKSGSTVYLWSGFLAALFLLPYNLFLAGRVHWGAGMALPMFFLGILGGWSVENLAVTVVCLSGGISFYAWKKHRGQAWLPVGAAGALLGLLGLLAAPGNFVRYDKQGEGKGLLIHIGNQFAGNGEMLIYILPAVLLLLLSWHLLKRSTGMSCWEERGSGRQWTAPQAAVLVCIVLMAVSYAEGGWAGRAVCFFLTDHVLAPLHLLQTKAPAHLANMTDDLEEFTIYLLGLWLLYVRAKRIAGLTGTSDRTPAGKALLRLWRICPAVRYPAALLGLCIFNNLVMIAAPTFPARAAFSSSFLFLAAVLSVLQIPDVRRGLVGGAGRFLLLGGGCIAMFFAVSALQISLAITRENAARVAYMESRAGSGEILAFPPMQTTNRAFRHVFFVDYHKGLTTRGICKYYGIQDIQVRDNARLPD